MPPLFILIKYYYLMICYWYGVLGNKGHTYKSPSNHSVVTHAYTSIDGCLIPMYSGRCPREIQIRKPGSARWMWTKEAEVMLDGGTINKMESEFEEAGCFPNVGVVKEQWIALSTARILEEYLAY